MALKISTVWYERREKVKNKGRECFLSRPTFVHPPKCGWNEKRLSGDD
jgi:hypothetical protein